MSLIRLSEKPSPAAAAGGSGDVTGPASSTDNTVARFDGTGGKTLQGSAVTISDGAAMHGWRRRVVAQTGSGLSIAASESATSFSNDGAIGLVDVELPSAAVGIEFIFTVLAAQIYQIAALGADVIRIGAAVSSAGGTMTSATVGVSVCLFCPKAGLWVGIAQGVPVLA